MKKLTQYVKYSSSVMVFIPSKQQNGKSIENLEALKDEILKQMSTLFGGATLSDAVGSYILNTGEVQKEGVTLCESFCKTLNAKLTSKVIELCEDLKARANQESVGLKINGEFYFI